jgi:hypothetical protein
MSTLLAVMSTSSDRLLYSARFSRENPFTDSESVSGVLLFSGISASLPDSPILKTLLEFNQASSVRTTAWRRPQVLPSKSSRVASSFTARFCDQHHYLLVFMDQTQFDTRPSLASEPIAKGRAKPCPAISGRILSLLRAPSRYGSLSWTSPRDSSTRLR